MRIAVVDQDLSQRKALCSTLENAGHQTLAFSSSADLSRQLRRDSLELILLDWPSAGQQGAELIQAARERLQTAIPVLFLTGYRTEHDIIAALTAGANDYLVKPIRHAELLTRVQVLLQRAYPVHHQPETLEFGHFVFEIRPARVLAAGVVVELTRKEFELALLLMRNLGRPLSRAYILESVWEHDADMPSRTLDTHISRIRNKLQWRPEHGFKLAPVYSYGYRLEQLDVAGY